MSKKIEMFVAAIAALVEANGLVANREQVLDAAHYFDGEHMRSVSGSCVYVQPHDIEATPMEKCGLHTSLNISHVMCPWIHYVLDCRIEIKPVLIQEVGGQLLVNNVVCNGIEDICAACGKVACPKPCPVWDKAKEVLRKDRGQLPAPPAEVLCCVECGNADCSHIITGKDGYERILSSDPDQSILEGADQSTLQHLDGFRVAIVVFWDGTCKTSLVPEGSFDLADWARSHAVVQRKDIRFYGFIEDAVHPPFKHCGKCDYDGDSCHGEIID